MARSVALGAFEQMVLLAALRLGEEAYAPRVAAELEARAGKDVSRGTLYAALDRLTNKGFLEWHVEASTSNRAGRRARRFAVTPGGVRALSESRASLIGLWDGVEHLLTEGGS
ncbi:MAG: helix-turn-helix transcriptional regulator [Gemmatimonadota bacterium]